MNFGPQKSRKADAWMAYYGDDYLGDTQHLTTIQHGAYHLIMWAAFKRGGYLPDDDLQLAAIARLTPTEWRKMSCIIRGFFRKADDGQTYLKRAREEFEKAQANAEYKAEHGRKGARERWRRHQETECPSNARAMPEQCTAGVEVVVEVVDKPTVLSNPGTDLSELALTQDASGGGPGFENVVRLPVTGRIS
jgi:uncharacterized protein YdaU (DUF1376 family)